MRPIRPIIEHRANRLTAAWNRPDRRPVARVPAALQGGPYQRLETDVGTVWMSVEDGVIRPFIHKNGTWEQEEGHLLRSLMRPGCRFLDVGANVGYFSLFAARHAPGGTIDCVEPLPSNLDLLRFNLWANDVDATVWPLALTGGDREVSMSVAPTNFGDARTSGISAEAGDVYDLVVPAAPADELFAGRGFDLIKIDVQGFEIDVLTGMTGVLHRSPGLQVVSEFWPGGLRQRGLDPHDVLRQYRALGFAIRVHVQDRLSELRDDEIVRLCDTGGENGQVNLLLTYERRT
jgi:FkbM family methyltransferase